MIGIITHVDQTEGRALFWTREMDQQIEIHSERVSELKAGTWISVPEKEIFEMNIVNFTLADPPFRTVLIPHGNTFQLRVWFVVAFPPRQWAVLHGYQALAHAKNVGAVGNFISRRLDFEPDVCYEAYVSYVADPSLIRRYRTVFSIPVQILRRVKDEMFLASCPWRCEMMADHAVENTIKIWHQWKMSGLNFDRMRELRYAGNRHEEEENCTAQIEDAQELVREAIPMIIEPKAEAISSAVKRSDPGLCVGIVVKCEPHYMLLYGKKHGLVLITLYNGLKYEMGTWLQYQCIAASEPEVPGVQHLAVFCTNVENRPGVSKVDNGKVQVFLEVTRCQETNLGSDDGLMVLESDVLGRVMAPSEPAIREQITRRKAVDTMIELDMTEMPNCRWIVKTWFIEGNPNQLTTNPPEAVVVPKSISPKPLESDEQEMHPAEFSTPISSPVKERKRVANRTRETRQMHMTRKEPVDSLTEQELGQYKVGDIRKKIPMAIFVRRYSRFGVLWTPSYKCILVTGEFLGEVPVGTWVKLKIANVQETDDESALRYKYMTVAKVVRIADVLPLRDQDGVLQVQVHLESGGEHIMSDGRLYFAKSSEVGTVLMDTDRVRFDSHEKRYMTWVTFVQRDEAHPWVVAYLEPLIEVDDEGNVIKRESEIPRRYNMMELGNDCETEVMGSEDESGSDEETDNEMTEGKEPENPGKLGNPENSETMFNSENLEEMVNPENTEKLTEKNGKVMETRGSEDRNEVLLEENVVEYHKTEEEYQEPGHTVDAENACGLNAMKVIFGDPSVRAFVAKSGHEFELATVLKWIGEDIRNDATAEFNDQSFSQDQCDEVNKPAETIDSNDPKEEEGQPEEMTQPIEPSQLEETVQPVELNELRETSQHNESYQQKEADEAIESFESVDSNHLEEPIKHIGTDCCEKTAQPEEAAKPTALDQDEETGQSTGSEVIHEAEETAESDSEQDWYQHVVSNELREASQIAEADESQETSQSIGSNELEREDELIESTQPRDTDESGQGMEAGQSEEQDELNGTYLSCERDQLSETGQSRDTSSQSSESCQLDDPHHDPQSNEADCIVDFWL